MEPNTTNFRGITVAAAFIGTVIREVVLDGYGDPKAGSISIAPFATTNDVGVFFSKIF